MKQKIRSLAKKIVGPKNIALLRLYSSYVLWNLKGKPIPAHGMYKWKTLRKMAAKHNIDTFVETGTAGGGTVLRLEKSFKKLYTIELDPFLYEKGRLSVDGRKRKASSIECIKGDSGVVIGEILARLDSPALFWLDAHYSGQGTARGALDTPIVQELQSIFSHPAKDHVIVIDDAREFNGTNDYPALDELKVIIAGLSSRHRIIQDNDIIIIEPALRAQAKP